jgi:Raf kinase inhibitor-like YbhB/YbcL family protein
VNPSFDWKDFPSNTKSFAIAVEDPDAPNGSFYHWLVKNIPINIVSVAENFNPGEQIKNDWEVKRYKGPKPPIGQNHRYFYRVYALSVENLTASDKQTFLSQIAQYKIAEASFMGRYKR